MLPTPLAGDRLFIGGVSEPGGTVIAVLPSDACCLGDCSKGQVQGGFNSGVTYSLGFTCVMRERPEKVRGTLAH